MSELIHRVKKLQSGAIYTVIGFRRKIDGVDIDFIGKGGIDINEDFSRKDLDDILNRVFPGVPPEKIKIRAHSSCGLNISIDQGLDEPEDL